MGYRSASPGGIIASVGTVPYTTTLCAQGDRRGVAVHALQTHLASSSNQPEPKGLCEVQEPILGHAPTRGPAGERRAKERVGTHPRRQQYGVPGSRRPASHPRGTPRFPRKNSMKRPMTSREEG